MGKENELHNTRQGWKFWINLWATRTHHGQGK